MGFFCISFSNRTSHARLILGEDLQGDVSLAALEDVDRLLMRQSLEGLAVHANDLKVDQRGATLTDLT